MGEVLGNFPRVAYLFGIQPEVVSVGEHVLQSEPDPGPLVFASVSSTQRAGSPLWSGRRPLWWFDRRTARQGGSKRRCREPRCLARTPQGSALRTGPAENQLQRHAVAAFSSHSVHTQDKNLSGPGGVLLGSAGSGDASWSVIASSPSSQVMRKVIEANLRLPLARRPATADKTDPQHQQSYRQHDAGNVGQVDHDVGLGGLRGEHRKKER
jgi:hypothetical protein